MSLQQRIQVFLERPVPPEAGPVSGSMAEGFLAAYVKNGSAGMGPEEAELLELCIAESESAAADGSPAEQEYFQEIAALLNAILHEITGGP